MDYKKAVKAKNACISTFLILTLWAMGHLKASKESIVKNPETVGLAFLIAYGLPICILLMLSIFYAVKAKQSEYDDLDDDNPEKSDEK